MLETFDPSAHNLVMTKSAIKRAVTAPAIKTYRGVKLQKTGGQGRFSLMKIREAVEAAVAKNADALAGGQ